MIVAGSKEDSPVYVKYCTNICADNRNTTSVTYNYTLNGVAYSGSLNPGACTDVCADVNSVTFSGGNGTFSVSTLCTDLADCTGGEAPGDGDSPPPTTYTVTWNVSADTLANSYVSDDVTATSGSSSITSAAVTSGSNASVTAYILPNVFYAYTLTNQVSVGVSGGTYSIGSIINGYIPVTLTYTNVTSSINITADFTDLNGGPDFSESYPGGDGSGSGATPTPTPTATPTPTPTPTATPTPTPTTYYYSVQCYSGCTSGPAIPVTWVGSALPIGTLVNIDTESGCYQIVSTTISSPVATIIGLCATSSPTATPTPTATATPTPTPYYKYVVECVSGACLQGTGRVVDTNTSYSIGQTVSLDNIAGCWEIMSVTSATPISTIVATCVSPTPTPTPLPVYKYVMDPCDGVSPNVIAQTNTPASIGTVYDLSGSAYADQAYTCIQTSTATPDTWILSASSCAGGDPPSCLFEGTKIEMHDGSLKNIEDILIGDTLMSRGVHGTPNIPDSDDPEVLAAWSSETISLPSELTQVSSVIGYNRNSIVYINGGLLYASQDHQHLVKTGGSWKIVKSSDLQLGDMLIDKNGQEIEITNLRTVYGDFIVYKIDVEQNDLFIANGIVTHNGKGEP